MKKYLLLALVVSFVVLTWTFVSRSAQPVQPIRIGCPVSLSGDAAFVGVPEKEGMEMLVADLNKEGGINGRPLEFIYYDDENKPDVAVNVVNRLIQKDKVTAVAGVGTSYTALAVTPILAKAQVPSLVFPSSLKIVEPINKWIFKVALDEKIGVAKLLSYLKAKGIQRIAIVTTQDPYGDGGRTQLIAQTPANGIKVVFDDKFTIEDTDVTPIVNKLKKTDAQAVVCWASYRAPIIFTSNYRQMGVDLPLFLSMNDLNPHYLNGAGKNAEGVMVASFKFYGTKDLPDSDPQKKVILDFVRAYEGKYKKECPIFAGTAYDAFNILVEALKKAGEDRNKLRDAIEKTRGFVGTQGIFNYAPDDHTGVTKQSLVMYRATGGEWKLVKE